MTIGEIALILSITVLSLLAVEAISQWLGLEPLERSDEDIEDRQW